MPDNKLDTVPFLKIVKKIEKKIFEIKPNKILTHSNLDLNIDHRIVSQAVITATRPTKKNYGLKKYYFIFFIKLRMEF